MTEMNYSHDHPNTSGVNLPPIRAMEFNRQAVISNSSHTAYSLPPPQPSTTRQLPPLPYQYPSHGMPQGPEYVTAARQHYAERPMGGYMHPGGHLPLSSTMDPNISIIPSRQLSKSKEVKRRTKTGCMTCRRRRIKVSGHLIRAQR